VAAGAGEVANSLAGIINALVKTLVILIGTGTPGLLIVSTDKNLKRRVQNLVGLYLKNCLRTYIHMTIFLASV
jgi:hypothetical protein